MKQCEILAELRATSSTQLHFELKNKTSSERAILAEIVCYIYEVRRRKFYLKRNHTSLFDYLVKEMKYSNASAMRRIDAADLIGEDPDLVEKLASGELTLNQISTVAQGLRQAKRERNREEKQSENQDEKREAVSPVAITVKSLLEKVSSQPTLQAQQIVAKALNLEVKSFEKKVLQRDESLRLEITLSKEEAELLKEVRDILSHKLPGASFKEVLVEGLREIKKRRDPTRVVRSRGNQAKHLPGVKRTEVAKVTSAAEVRRTVFRKDKSCRWKFNNGQVCGSKFQLQADHKQSKWLGGSDEINNLQLLCSAHNKLKYQHEIGML